MANDIVPGRGNGIIFKNNRRGDGNLKKFIFALCTLIILITAGCGERAEVTTRSEIKGKDDGSLQLHFIDVGQADAILVTTGEANMLIDAGNNNDGELVVKYLQDQGIGKLDVVMGTHPHEDHVGGLDVAIKRFDVGEVYLPRVTHTTKTYRDVLAALKEKQIKAVAAGGGQSFQLGQAKVELLAPNSSKYKELNNYSIVCKITFGDTRFLLAGDAEELSEQEILQKGYDLKADLLKVAHHGSRSSTSDAFLKAVSPKTAIISVAKENDYGHPHRETLERLRQSGIKVYQTAESRTIKVVSDGKNIDIKESRPAPKLPADQEIQGEKIYVDNTGKGLIKGNINNNGDKIYHLPGQVNYEQTKAEQWFKTEREAKEAGFRRAKR